LVYYTFVLSSSNIILFALSDHAKAFFDLNPEKLKHRATKLLNTSLANLSELLSLKYYIWNINFHLVQHAIVLSHPEINL